MGNFFDAHANAWLPKEAIGIIEERFRQARKRESRRKRAMFWFVTHGHIIDVPLESAIYYAHIVLRTPKDVRTLLSKIIYAPRYEVVNKRTGIRREVNGKRLFIYSDDMHDKIFNDAIPY